MKHTFKGTCDKCLSNSPYVMTCYNIDGSQINLCEVCIRDEEYCFDCGVYVGAENKYHSIHPGQCEDCHDQDMKR